MEMYDGRNVVREYVHLLFSREEKKEHARVRPPRGSVKDQTGAATWERVTFSLYRVR